MSASRRRPLRYHGPVKFPLFLTLAATAFAQFHLKDGDRVVFFGDSITDQRLYTTFVETYALTRFPKLNVTFVHSGWGGDRVTGGAGGGIAERLNRDVLAYQPTVATIMLGMNDGRVRAFDDQIFAIYSNGYKQIVKRLKEGRPGIRITAIQPSPYDDVTREPRFPGGYNGVLLRYSEFLAGLAASEGLTLADLNNPVTAMLVKANAADHDNALKILPDRVHPGPAGHLIMAGGLLKAWGAPAIVSETEIDARQGRLTRSVNTTIDGLASGLRWTQTDAALPMPIDLNDPVIALAVRSSDFEDSFNRQILRLTGLPAGPHTLRIDGSEIATFDGSAWAAGVNLARYRTPMWEQAMRTHQLTLRHNTIHFQRWRTVEVPLAESKPEGMAQAISALDALEAGIVRQQRAMAQPVAHRFELMAGASAFKPIFNGTDLAGWHRSLINHHGVTEAWRVENGAITGMQDKPGHGGILLTDRKYRDFEIQLEINPDFSCDSGLFLRATEKGEAYQVLLDYLDGGIIGGIYGERLPEVKLQPAPWQDHFRRGEWNHLRARIEGAVPRIQVWLNGAKITDWRDTANHLPGGATEGMIAVQVHGGNRWIPGGKHRFRNLMVRELN